MEIKIPKTFQKVYDMIINSCLFEKMLYDIIFHHLLQTSYCKERTRANAIFLESIIDMFYEKS